LSYFSHLLKRRIKRLFDNYFDLSREFNAKQQAFQIIGYGEQWKVALILLWCSL
jgi:hypothetical protein